MRTDLRSSSYERPVLTMRSVYSFRRQD